MPPADVVEENFKALAAELDLPKEAIAAMSLQNKWTLLVQNGKTAATTTGLDTAGREKGKIQDKPQYYVNSLKVEHSLETLHSLLIMLRSQPISWLKQFCDFGGVEVLLDILAGLEMMGEKLWMADRKSVV